VLCEDCKPYRRRMIQYALPLNASLDSQLPQLLVPRVMSEEDWTQMMKLLAVMKPGMVCGPNHLGEDSPHSHEPGRSEHS
jgi:hypothetical protein